MIRKEYTNRNQFAIDLKVTIYFVPAFRHITFRSKINSFSLLFILSHVLRHQVHMSPG